VIQNARVNAALENKLFKDTLAAIFCHLNVQPLTPMEQTSVAAEDWLSRIGV
jgi:hypothetical protein